MLIQGTLNHLRHRPAAASVDWLDLTWQQCDRRAMRVRTRGGREARILLPIGVHLGHEDVLWSSEDGRELIAVNLLPTEVLVGRSRDASALARLAYEIGNLHVPLQLDHWQVIAPADGPVEEAFDRVGILFDVQTRRFEPTCRGTVEITVAPELSIIRK